MQWIGRTLFKALGVALTLATSLYSLAWAHDGHAPGDARHGGVDAQTKQHHFEVVFTPRGVTLYTHDAAHKVVDGRNLKVNATFFHPNSPEKPWFSRDLQAASPGRPAESLHLAVDLAKAPASGVKVAFRVAGLPSATEPAAEFTVPLAFAKSVEFTVAKATPADQAAVAKLKLCPVSGEDLGSMGGPLKVTRGGQSTFICCKGCLEELKDHPDKYFRKSGQ